MKFLFMRIIKVRIIFSNTSLTITVLYSRIYSKNRNKLIKTILELAPTPIYNKGSVGIFLISTN